MTDSFVSPVRVGAAEAGQPGVLLPRSLALLLGPGLTATYDPNVVSTDGDGANITGAVRVTVAPGIVGSSLALGSQDPPQYVATVGATTTISTGTNSGALLIPVPAGRKVQAEVSLQAFLTLPVPGILVPASVLFVIEAASYGTSGPIVVKQTLDSDRTLNTPWIGNSFNVSAVGGNLSIDIGAVTPPAFVSGNAYTGGYAGGTTCPNAVGDGLNHVVTNDSGKIYVCVAGGTDSSSGGPTGAGAGDITVGGLTWRYVAAAGSHLALTYTVCLDGVKTG